MYNYRKPYRRRSKKLKVSVGVLIVVFFIVLFVFQVNNAQNLKKIETTKKSGGIIGRSLGASLSNFSISGLLDETNSTRVQNSASPLELNEVLNRSAQAKCEDMIQKNYWDHIAPDGTEPWKFVVNSGYKSYIDLGENLAFGYYDNKSTVRGWFNSPGHKANLLSSKYRDVGFGFCRSDNYIAGGAGVLVVQHFGSQKDQGTAPSPVSQPSVSPIKAYTPSVCTKIPIPYKTNYVEVSYLKVGQTSSYGGYDGYTQHCIADSTGYAPPDFVVQPIDKTVNVGTRSP